MMEKLILCAVLILTIMLAFIYTPMGLYVVLAIQR